MTACVVLPHNAGLFSLINKVITCLGMYDYVHVNWDHPGCWYGNAWPVLFEPNQHPRELGLEWTEIEEYPDYRLTGQDAQDLYASGDEWRKEYNKQWKKLFLRMDIAMLAADFIDTLPEGYITVQVRSEPHGREQRRGSAQTKQEYQEAVWKVLNESYRPGVFVVSSDEQSLDWFDGTLYPSFIYPHTRRTSNRSIDHLSMTHTIQDAINTMVEVLVMSRSKVLIHPVSNMATAALGINPEVKSVYLP